MNEQGSIRISFDVAIGDLIRLADVERVKVEVVGGGGRCLR